MTGRRRPHAHSRGRTLTSAAGPPAVPGIPSGDAVRSCARAGSPTVRGSHERPEHHGPGRRPGRARGDQRGARAGGSTARGRAGSGAPAAPSRDPRRRRAACGAPYGSPRPAARARHRQAPRGDAGGGGRRRRGPRAGATSRGDAARPAPGQRRAAQRPPARDGLPADGAGGHRRGGRQLPRGAAAGRLRRRRPVPRGPAPRARAAVRAGSGCVRRSAERRRPGVPVPGQGARGRRGGPPRAARRGRADRLGPAGGRARRAGARHSPPRPVRWGVPAP